VHRNKKTGPYTIAGETLVTRNEVPLRAALIDATIDDIANHGLEAVSLRRISAAVGRSTTAIFQHFGGKSGLLRASLDHAFECDRAFHKAMLDEIEGLVPDHNALVTVIALYIENLATAARAPIWREILFKAAQLEDAAGLLDRWYAMREDHWRNVCRVTPGRDHLPPLLVAYTAMEEVYASVLHADLGYRLALRETIERLLDAAFDRPASISSEVAIWQEKRVPAPPAPERKGDGALAERLIDVAAREIFQHGVMTLNHRRLTALAGVSPAMIVYHFGDMVTLANAAIWRALMQGLPAFLDDEIPETSSRGTMAAWATTLGETVSHGASGPSAGFYIAYARIVGQVCLLARRNESLVPLVRHLRSIEGSGVYRASKFSWPTMLEMSRANAAGFAIWIKGFAILNGGLARDKVDPRILIDAISALVARPNS